jgi:hypothetical protein
MTSDLASSGSGASPAPESVRPREVLVLAWPRPHPFMDETVRRFITFDQLYACLNGQLGAGELFLDIMSREK